MIDNYKKDELTKLYLRDYLTHIYKNFNDNALMILFDLRKLKSINDNYGHNEGDKFLLFFAETLINEFDQNSTIRMGGDEFLVLTNDNIDVVFKKIDSMVIKIKGFIEQRVCLDNSPFNAGIVKVNSDMSHDLLCADLAMYDAKQKELPYIVFNDSLLDNYFDEEKFIERIDQMILEKDFNIKIESIGENICDTKILDRSNKEFYNNPLLIKRNKIFKIDFMSLEYILENHINNERTTIINVYQDTLFNQDNNYLSYLEEGIKKHNLDPSKICINIDTNNYKGKPSDLHKKLFDLKKIGVKTSIGIIDIYERNDLLSILSFCELDYMKISNKINNKQSDGYMIVIEAILNILKKKQITAIFMN
jgi:diguanylate cyclase (GGDEF)-like protein